MSVSSYLLEPLINCFYPNPNAVEETSKVKTRASKSPQSLSLVPRDTFERHFALAEKPPVTDGDGDGDGDGDSVGVARDSDSESSQSDGKGVSFAKIVYTDEEYMNLDEEEDAEAARDAENARKAVEAARDAENARKAVEAAEAAEAARNAIEVSNHPFITTDKVIDKVINELRNSNPQAVAELLEKFEKDETRHAILMYGQEFVYNGETLFAPAVLFATNSNGFPEVPEVLKKVMPKETIESLEAFKRKHPMVFVKLSIALLEAKNNAEQISRKARLALKQEAEAAAEKEEEEDPRHASSSNSVHVDYDVIIDSVDEPGAVSGVHSNQKQKPDAYVKEADKQHQTSTVLGLKRRESLIAKLEKLEKEFSAKYSKNTETSSADKEQITRLGKLEKEFSAKYSKNTETSSADKEQELKEMLAIREAILITKLEKLENEFSAKYSKNTETSSADKEQELRKMWAIREVLEKTKSSTVKKGIKPVLVVAPLTTKKVEKKPARLLNGAVCSSDVRNEFPKRTSEPKTNKQPTTSKKTGPTASKLKRREERLTIEWKNLQYFLVQYQQKEGTPFHKTSKVKERISAIRADLRDLEKKNLEEKKKSTAAVKKKTTPRKVVSSKRIPDDNQLVHAFLSLFGL